VILALTTLHTHLLLIKDSYTTKKIGCRKCKRLSNKATIEQTVVRGFELQIVKVFNFTNYVLKRRIWQLLKMKETHSVTLI
jgi:hypothetical protein